MQNDALLFIRVAFAGLFFLTVVVGVGLAVNFQRFFGADPQIPSETGSARTYSRVTVWLVWAHAFFLTGSFALMLH